MKKNILHVVPTLKKDGAETQLVILLKELKKNDEFIELLTFDLYQEGESIEPNLIDLDINIDVCNRNIFSTILYLNRKVKEGNYDLVHSHLPRADIAVGVASFFSSFKHVVSVHAQYGTRKGESGLKYLLIIPLWRWIIRKADSVIAISEKVKLWLASSRINQKVSVVLYGIEPKEITHKFKGSNHIGMAARFLPWKGWDRVIEVALNLKSKDYPFYLHLAGPDDIGYKEELVSLVKDNELNDYVFFHDEFQNIYDFFDLIDTFIFLSESEGFGLVLLEAMSYGVPIVCSDISPINEFVDSTTGILVDRNDVDSITGEITSLLSSKKDQLSMKENQINKVSNHLNAEIMARKVKELYYLP